MKITLSVEGDLKQHEVELAADATVAQLLAVIEEKTTLKKDSVRLIHDGKIVPISKPEITLTDLQFKDGDKVHILQQIRPTRQTSQAATSTAVPNAVAQDQQAGTEYINVVFGTDQAGQQRIISGNLRNMEDLPPGMTQVFQQMFGPLLQQAAEQPRRQQSRSTTSSQQQAAQTQTGAAQQTTQQPVQQTAQQTPFNPFRPPTQRASEQKPAEQKDKKDKEKQNQKEQKDQKEAAQIQEKQNDEKPVAKQADKLDQSNQNTQQNTQQKQAESQQQQQQDANTQSKHSKKPLLEQEVEKSTDEKDSSKKEKKKHSSDKKWKKEKIEQVQKLYDTQLPTVTDTLQQMSSIAAEYETMQLVQSFQSEQQKLMAVYHSNIQKLRTSEQKLIGLGIKGVDVSKQMYQNIQFQKKILKIMETELTQTMQKNTQQQEKENKQLTFLQQIQDKAGVDISEMTNEEQVELLESVDKQLKK